MIIAENGDYPNAHNALGCLLANSGGYREAHACFTRAVELEPENASFHFNLGLAYEKLGMFEKAAETYARITQLDPRFHAQAAVRLRNLPGCTLEAP
jgi:Flp pilus assembly protein TadD